MSFYRNLFQAKVYHTAVVHIVTDANGDIVVFFLSYRRVSNTLFREKLSEKVALVQLNVHLEVNKLFDRNKSGFQKLQTCGGAMSEEVHDGQKCISNSKLVLIGLIFGGRYHRLGIAPGEPS